MNTAVQPTCPYGHLMVKRDGNFGPFWGCSKYPECRETKRIELSAPEIKPIDDPTQYIEIKKTSTKWKEICWKNIVEGQIRKQLGSLEKERTKYRMDLDDINKMKPIDKPIGVYDEPQPDPNDPVNINRKEKLEKYIKNNQKAQKKLCGSLWSC